jgi:hypothetical protein
MGIAGVEPRHPPSWYSLQRQAVADDVLPQAIKAVVWRLQQSW